MKIALFGGSFNPVHNEHINIVASAVRELQLDKVIIMPSYATPNKAGKITASAADRLNMCRIAFGGIPCAEVSDFEIDNGGISYSYLTCREFKRRYPKDELYFIIGADMLENFKLWKYPEKILECVTLAVCGREKPLNSRRAFPYVEFSYVGAKVSSTRIRTLAALGEDISAYVSENVANYIKNNSLYKIDGLQNVKNYLTEKRWQHTVRVAVTAAENCARFGVSEERAVTAAALHDCAKYVPSDRGLLKGFTLPEGVPETVVHQYTGAYVAEKVFGIHDADILNAIRYHTSGRENMSPLEKLILISDMLEEGRSYEGIDDIRQAFSENTERGLYLALERQLGYLESTGKPVYNLTRKALNYLKENKNDE